MQKRLSWLLWGLAILGLVAGLYGFYARFTMGHQMASYGSYVPWGLWVAAYIALVGASAGAVAVAAVLLMARQQAYYPVARLALLVALVTFMAGMLNVWLDLGHPFRAWKLLLQTSWTSVMGWMAWFYTLYGVLLVVGLWSTRKGEVPFWMQRYALLVFLFALAFAGAEGALFGVVGARPMWESGLTPVLFLVEGALFGVGFVAAASYISGLLTGDLVRRVRLILLWLLAILVLVEWAEFSTGLYASIPAKAEVLRTILAGDFWWVFWGLHLGLGVFVPALLLLWGRQQPWVTALAGLLIGSMGLASKINLVVPALAQEELEGLAHAYTGPGLSFHYFPTLEEWLVFGGTVSLALLIFLIGGHLLHLIPTSEVA
ncbi:polysulfide reductase NrfD [Litorilinea aerophila]|uniref:Polysulfide reductase n=1 Tax=Litorilinea aerophila TaxID=1204385 RepID=A0A540VLT9_9CHLR|nr:NrfD/PsrC family molybdoenzyme membrane anchor subunit [Litorilinea aerophila]MCC9074946.1 polysulfide reductase NrfD [Litorilinea aerophila]OUC07219.1 hypothetical protein RY27_16175 [Litorilinea aerophila]GIV76932.1 MAG: polysulfide reductase [Litorilinea sp.]